MRFSLVALEGINSINKWQVYTLWGMLNDVSAVKAGKSLIHVLSYEVSGLIGEYSLLPKVGGNNKG